MRRFLLKLLALFCFLPCVAQDEVARSVLPDTLYASPFPRATLLRPGYSFGGFCDFTPLHEGLNASLSLSATFGLGRHTPSGVGFGRDLSLAWLAPSKDRWTYALGVLHSQFDWGAIRTNQVGLAGALYYALNNNVTLSVSGYKSIVDAAPRHSWPVYRPDSHIEGAVDFRLNDGVMFHFSVGVTNFHGGNMFMPFGPAISTGRTAPATPRLVTPAQSDHNTMQPSR